MPIDLATQIASQANKHARQNVIIQFSSAFGVRHHALITKLGGIVRHQFGNRDSVLAEISLGKIEELARDERVRQITPDRNVSANLDAAKIVTGADVARKKAQSVYGTTYSALDGSGIGVAVIDSGVGMNAANKEFVATSGNSRLVHFKDFSDDLGATRAYDDYGHGTGVAGVIAGNGWASKQTGADRLEWYPGNYGDFDGLAPNASIVALRVIRKDGSGTISSVIKAIDYAIALQAKYNIRIINISLGAPVVQSYRTDPLCLAAARAVKAGIVVVCSAGNYGHNDVIISYDANGKPVYQTVYGSIVSPGNDPSVITVGATKDPQETLLTWRDASTPPNVAKSPAPLRRSDLIVAQYSSRGPTLVDGLVKPDVVAPGTQIITTAANNTALLLDKVLPQNVMPPTSASGVKKMYCQLSGTSFAAPVVSGIAALMLQANPTLTPGQVKALLIFTAQKLEGSARPWRSLADSLFSQGAGLVNAHGAVRLAQNSRPDANLLKSGDSLLLPDRTLTGLAPDLSLVFKDSSGNILERALFNSGIIMSDGTPWPQGIIMSDSTVLATSFTTAGRQSFAMERGLANFARDPVRRFYSEGINASTRRAYGRFVFSSQGQSLWANAVLNPLSFAAGISPVDSDVLAGKDDVPTRGVSLLTASSPYYPRQ
ncbi:MAG: S8 family peptidase [Acidobacteria bacterium]|nr:S8 family peptidase [Acidobacteriota bacterium]